MNYVVIRISTTEGTTDISTPEAYTDYDLAQSAYHTACATAAVSHEEVDTVLLLKETGFVVAWECFKHEVEPEVEAVT